MTRSDFVSSLLDDAPRSYADADGFTFRNPPELLKKLAAMAGWNDFARSLVDQSNRGRQWSEKQIAAAERMVTKVADKESAKEKSATTVDLSPIQDMFQAAVASGYKKPTYRAHGLVISLASSGSRNAGALYVKSEGGIYGGKVIGTKFHPTRDGSAKGFVSIDAKDMDGSRMTIEKTAAEALAHISADPLGAAIRYGRETGRCACCGRELTNEISVEMGIGPVCREKWGF